MAKRFYVQPLDEVLYPDGTTDRGAKYFKWSRDPDPPALMGDLVYTMVQYYGPEAVALLWADVTPEQHTLLSSQSDVIAVPSNIDNNVGNARATAIARLEALNVPGGWIVSGASWRQVMRALAGMFAVSCSFEQLGYRRLMPAGVTMTTAFADMPVAYRTALLQAIDGHGYDRSTLNNQSTLRDLLTVIANQPRPTVGIDS